MDIDGAAVSPRSDTGEVGIDVTPVNDAPIAVGDTAIVSEEVTVLVDVLDDDADVDNTRTDLSIEAGSVSLVDPTQGTVSIDDGMVSFTGARSFVGTAVVDYKVTGGPLDDGGQVTITVNDAPTPPESTFAISTAGETPEGSRMYVQIDIDPALTRGTNYALIPVGGTATEGQDYIQGATIADGRGVGTIIDNDEPITYELTNNGPVAEGNDLVFTFTAGRASATGTPLQINTSCSADSPDDIGSIEHSGILRAGEATFVYRVPTVDDIVDETDGVLNVDVLDPGRARQTLGTRTRAAGFDPRQTFALDFRYAEEARFEGPCQGRRVR